MTGWRLGWAVLPEALAPAVERLGMHYFLCASAPAQHAALAAFTPESLAICEERRTELAARRALVLEGLERIGLPVPAPPERRVLRLLRRRRHWPRRLGVLRPRARRGPRRAHARQGLRRPQRRHARAPLLRRLPRRAAGRPPAPRRVRRVASLVAVRCGGALARSGPATHRARGVPRDPRPGARRMRTGPFSWGAGGKLALCASYVLHPPGERAATRHPGTRAFA